MNIIIEAAQYAALAHNGQLRKYNGDPFFEHPKRVANRAMLIPGIEEEVVAAAFLHDVKEDQPKFWPLPERFPDIVFSLVDQLTNPSKEFQMLHRAERKAMDREHLKRVSREAKLIKYLDRIDNLRDMDAAPDTFKTIYLHESRLLAEALRIPETEPGDHLRFTLSNLHWELTSLITSMWVSRRSA